MAADTAGSRRFEARPAGEGRVREAGGRAPSYREGLWASQGKNEDQREYSPKRGWLTRRLLGSGEEEPRSSSARDATRRAEARGPGTRVRGRRAGRGPGARGAGRGPEAQRKPNAESPREVTRKRREGAARGREEAEGVAEAGAAGEQGTRPAWPTARRGRARPPGHTGRQGGTPCVRAWATRVPHVCTRARVAERGRAGRVGQQRASVREREKVDLEPKTRHEQLPKITQTCFARSLARPFTESRSISHRDTLTPNAATRSSRRRGPGAVTLCGLAGSHQFSKQDRHPLVLQFRSQYHKD